MILLQQQREETCDISLHIAITGESGSGKSTFVNAVRGLRNGDEGAAPTGAVERSKEPMPYFHPGYPNVTLWDLPGVGTMKYPAHKYLELVKFDRFDFFIIVSDTGCRENDVKLAQEIQKMKKKCYFVRSKIDNFMRDERRNEDFSAERSLREMRKNCVQGLRDQGIVSPQVFLVSSFEPNLYDFSLLQQTLDRDLPKNKRDTLLFIMPNINPEIIIKKKKAFQSRIKYWAGLSGTVAAVPVPGLSVAVDIGLMVSVVKSYVTDFSIDKSSLEKLAERTNVQHADLCAVVRSPLAGVEITPELLTRVLTQLAFIAAFMTAEESFRWIPVVGLVASAGLSFVVTYRALNSFLNTLADDAQRVFEKALGLN
ncbi:interferon-inducible GTPase 5-like [Astatotilapia calliptera]|uniref:IRG-type G domain-containing protein n=1 Tax=Astatotilapia calliptera TaxID=8154 RepID=A0AAX7TZ88_ASTCA|nr:interferon-inducible GTPase 5-like [Astatotilapia calliptera]